jgi:hypothetical protein
MEHDRRVEVAVRGAMAVLLVSVGGFLLALALGLHPAGGDALRAPAWVVGAAGVTLAAAGAVILFPNERVAGWAVAMLFLAGSGCAALWVGLWADPSGISGGLPLISDQANTRIGRVVFTLGGVGCLALLVVGLRLGPQRQRED